MKKNNLLMLCLLWQCVLTLNILLANGDKTQGSLKSVFEESYVHWQEYCDRIEYSSNAMLRFESQHYDRIVCLGPAVLPYIIEKIKEDTSFHWIHWACSDIAEIIKDPNVSPWARELTLDWWYGGQKQVNDRFDSTFSEWQKSIAVDDSLQAIISRNAIKALGIATLPRMMDKLYAGEYDVMPMLHDRLDHMIMIKGQTQKKEAEEFLKWWEENSEKWLIPFEDQGILKNQEGGESDKK